VIEDAVDGVVQAARAGNMAALGLAHADDEELLTNAHADLVVTTLDDVSLGTLAEGRLERASV
jgi:beta-phosphoglucomutase